MSNKNRELPLDYDLNGHALKNARLVGCRAKDSSKTIEDVLTEHTNKIASHTASLVGRVKWIGRVAANPTENNAPGDLIRNTTSNKTYIWDKNEAAYIVLSDDSSAARNAELDQTLTEGEEGEEVEVNYYGFGTEESAVYCKSETPAASAATYTITEGVATEAEETVSAYHALYEWIEI